MWNLFINWRLFWVGVTLFVLLLANMQFCPTSGLADLCCWTFSAFYELTLFTSGRWAGWWRVQAIFSLIKLVLVLTLTCQACRSSWLKYSQCALYGVSTGKWYHCPDISPGSTSKYGKTNQTGRDSRLKSPQLERRWELSWWVLPNSWGNSSDKICIGLQAVTVSGWEVCADQVLFHRVHQQNQMAASWRGWFMRGFC